MVCVTKNVPLNKQALPVDLSKFADYLLAVVDCKNLREKDLALHIFVSCGTQAQCLAQSRHTVTPIEYLLKQLLKSMHILPKLVPWHSLKALEMGGYMYHYAD